MKTSDARKQFRNISTSRILLIWILFSVLLIASLLGWQWYMQCQVSRDYAAVLGRIYQQDEAAGALAAQVILQSGSNADDAALGEAVLVQLGYTSDGIEMAKGSLLSAGSIFPVGIFVLLAACILFGVLLAQALYQTRLREHEQTEALVREDTASLISYMEGNVRQTRQFMENVAHQVKIPLTGLLVTLDLADAGADTELHDLIESGKKQITRVSRLMDRLLKIGRIEAGKVIFEKNMEDLSQILRSLPLSPEQKGCVKYELEPAEMRLDRDWMSEAIYCITEDCLEVSREVHIRLISGSNDIRIEIMGDKAPFSEEETQYLFSRFYIPEQAEDSGHYGIGLHFASLVITGHNGAISAFAEEGNGGFIITFPKLALKVGKV
ncbi:MAG: HAMP domain-containing histidine kinase [Clostridiales bacterium]|nr:HAMP domain-containing histidine kinase [Clostridiales bacterium]